MQYFTSGNLILLKIKIQPPTLESLWNDSTDLSLSAAVAEIMAPCIYSRRQIENQHPIHVTVITYAYSALEKDTCARLMRSRLRLHATYASERRRIERPQIMSFVYYMQVPPVFILCMVEHICPHYYTLLFDSAEGTGFFKGGAVAEQQLKRLTQT